MKKLLESISSKLAELKAGKLTQAEVKELAEEQQVLMRILFFESSDAMLIVNEEARCVAANQATLDMLGYPRDEMLSLHGWDWDAMMNKETILDAVINIPPHFETMVKTKQGDVFPVEVTTNALTHEGQLYRFCIVRDLSDIKQHEAQIQKMAITDDLTGLINRREFTKLLNLQIERARRYAEPFSLLMLDIDCFKNINDQYGHDVGDKVLIEFTKRLKGVSRKTDTEARWGGDEFMVMLPNTTQSEAEQVAQKLRASFENHDFKLDERVTISIGCAQYTEHDTSATLFKRVDGVLYKAKENGRNRVESY